MNKYNVFLSVAVYAENAAQAESQVCEPIEAAILGGVYAAFSLDETIQFDADDEAQS